MATKFGVWASTAILGFVLAQTVSAQSSEDVRALSKEIETLKAGQMAIQKDLQEIKGLLQGAQAAAQAPAPTRAAPSSIETVDMVLNVAGAPVKGEKTAKVTVVEFTDYQCPFCSRHFRQTWPQLE